MLRVWIVGTPLLPVIVATRFFSSAILLLHLIVLRSGAQSVIIGGGARHSDNLDKYKRV